jgi:multidrug resistance efflux pump
MNDAPTRPPEPVRLDDPVELPPSEAQQKAQSGGWSPPRRGLKTTIILAGIALAGALVVLYAWGLPPFTRTVEITDNAYVRGWTTIIAPQVSGYVDDVLVQDFHYVRAGDPLVRVDQRIYQQRVDQGRANVQTALANLRNADQSQRSAEANVEAQKAAIGSAEAQLARAQADMRRVDELVDRGSVSLRERDQTLAALRQAEAQMNQSRAQLAIAEEQVRTVEVNRGGLAAAVENARAGLKLAEIDLANTVIRAPRDGQLSEIGVRVGQYVTAGTQLLFLVPPTVWVVANYKEIQTARMQPGQAAEVRVDALDGAALTGRVADLAPAAGNEFAIIKPDNATGNFVKVVQRIPVKIVLDPGQPLLRRLRPGMSVEARIDTASTIRLPAGAARRP